jgi:hypothetical protein
MENFIRHAWKNSLAILTINSFDGLAVGFDGRTENGLVCMIGFVASFLGVQGFLRTGCVSRSTDGSRMTRECPVRFCEQLRVKFPRLTHPPWDKGRGFCPSCGARCMAEAAIYLRDELVPLVPVRQFVVTPRGLPLVVPRDFLRSRFLLRSAFGLLAPTSFVRIFARKLLMLSINIFANKPMFPTALPVR